MEHFGDTENFFGVSFSGLVAAPLARDGLFGLGILKIFLHSDDSYRILKCLYDESLPIRLDVLP